MSARWARAARSADRRRPLREVYDELNAQFFGGRLPHPLRELVIGGPVETRGILVRRVGARDGMRGLRFRAGQKQGHCSGIFCPPGRFWPAAIRVLSPLGGEYERRVLLHEMSHAAVWFAGFRQEAHGPRFVAELTRLADLGEAWALEAAGRYAHLEDEDAG